MRPAARSNRRRRVAGAFSSPCCTSTWSFSFPSATGERGHRLLRPRVVVEHDESLYAAALDQQIEAVLWAGCGFGVVVVGDRPAKHHAPVERESRQRRVRLMLKHTEGSNLAPSASYAIVFAAVLPLRIGSGIGP
jgi:hypothetical protein